MVDIDAETWRRVFDTNVTGAALVTAAAIPHLSASAGKAIYLSSIAGQLTPPWPGLGAYAVSKAALEKLVDAWRAEHPGIGFTRLVVGDCAGGEGDARTQFNAGWDHELAAECYPIWLGRNYMSGALMEVEDLVEVVNTILRTGASTAMPIVVATSRPPVTLAVKTGRLSQPRTVEVRAWTAWSRSTSHIGKRFSTSSSATRPSSRASAAPRQKWMP